MREANRSAPVLPVSRIVLTRFPLPAVAVRTAADAAFCPVGAGLLDWRSQYAPPAISAITRRIHRPPRFGRLGAGRTRLGAIGGASGLGVSVGADTGLIRNCMQDLSGRPYPSQSLMTGFPLKYLKSNDEKSLPMVIAAAVFQRKTRRRRSWISATSQTSWAGRDLNAREKRGELARHGVQELRVAPGSAQFIQQQFH